MGHTEEQKVRVKNLRAAPPDGIDPSLLSPDQLEELGRKILGISNYYCEEFVPSQLSEVEHHIDLVNERIANTVDPEDYQKLAGALSHFTKIQSQLVQEITVVYMASIRPMKALAEQMQAEKKKLEESLRRRGLESEDDVKEYELGDDLLESYHQPYND